MAKYLRIYKNNTEISGKTYTESIDKLNEILPEINYGLLSSVIILSQGMPNKFSSFSPSGRKELLEKLTKSDFMIEDLKARVLVRAETLTKQLRSIEDRLLINQTKQQTLQNTIEDLTKKLATMIKPNFDSEILKIKEELVQLQSSTAEITSSTDAIKLDIDELNKQLLEKNNAKNVELATLNENFAAKYNELTTTQTKLQTQSSVLQKEILKLKNIKDICPTCGQKIPGVHKVSTEPQEKELASLQQQIKVQSELIAGCIAKKDEYIKEINNRHDGTIKELNQQAIINKQTLKAAEETKQALQSSIITLNNKLSQLQAEQTTWDNKQAELTAEQSKKKTELTAIVGLLEELLTQQTEIKDRLTIIKKMEQLLKRDFRGFLLSNIIEYINKKAKEFSEIVFGTTELSVQLDGNALEISYYNKLIDNLSGGEKTRVDLILQLALRDMLINYLGFNSNLIVLDEISDFLDKKSCKAVMDLLTKELTTTESVFIVSHHAEALEIPIDSELKVIKTETGISTVLN